VSQPAIEHLNSPAKELLHRQPLLSRVFNLVRELITPQNGKMQRQVPRFPDQQKQMVDTINRELGRGRGRGKRMGGSGRRKRARRYGSW